MCLQDVLLHRRHNVVENEEPVLIELNVPQTLDECPGSMTGNEIEKQIDPNHQFSDFEAMIPPMLCTSPVNHRS